MRIAAGGRRDGPGVVDVRDSLAVGMVVSRAIVMRRDAEPWATAHGSRMSV